MMLDRRQALLVIGGGIALPSVLPAQEPVPPGQIELSAGPLTMVFEPELAFLRYIRYGDREVLRGLYAAVRDRNWGTVPPHVTNLKIERSEGEFQMTFNVGCRQREIEFDWKGTITGRKDGSVVFDFDGAARTTFLRNRIGFCVLHPVEECAGQPARVEKDDKTVENGRFPLQIAPNQPFMNMRAITHTVVPGVQAEVRFAGDVFEMEDQRNWTDGSYKTYCTPLARPFPAEVQAGTSIRQSVSVRLSGTGSAPAVKRNRAIELTAASTAATRLPAIGLGLSTAAESMTARDTARLKALAPSHLRADLKLYEGAFEKDLERASNQAASIGAGLELALFVGSAPESELKRLADAARNLKAPIKHYLIFHRDEKSTSAGTMKLARQALRTNIASGTNAYFTELNRERPPLAESDMVTYSMNPQVHAFDPLSLIETLEMQAVTLASAREFCGKLPLIVSPVTLRPRFNPNATAAMKQEGPLRELPFEVDPRQPSLFAAGWTLGSLKYLAEGGAASATFYETVGWRGVMETEKGSPLPDKFPSKPGVVFPLYHVLADVNQFQGGEVTPLKSSSRLEVEGMLIRKNNAQRLLVANLSPEPKVVRVRSALGKALQLRMLDSENVAEAMNSPESFRAKPARRMDSAEVIQLGLLPYAIARIDHV
jgi:hypothetical protein